MFRSLPRVLGSLAIVLSLAIFLSLILTPDPVGNVFSKALRLEASGQTGRAVEAYELIASRHPESSYAPRALMRVAELLVAQGRQQTDEKALRRGVEAYVQLATTYPSDPFALSALQNGGAVAAEELSDRPLARRIYRQILQTQGRTSEIGADALVKLARLSIEDGDGKNAQLWLQDVLRRWPKSVGVASQAQYFLGVCYETVFHKRDWASRAYNRVIADFPASEWAGEARQRLGLLAYADSLGRLPTRRVWLNIAALPDQPPADGDEGALWNALRLALAARGLSGDATLLQGYSLAPFYAGLDLQNAGQVVDSGADSWQNVASAAGFRVSIKSGGREDEALRDLQDDLDAARLPLVCWQNGGKPMWSLAVGYDSERGEVMLQNRGAQFDTLAAKTWAKSWNTPSPWGKSYTLVALVPEGKAIANPSLTPTPAPTAKPGQTPPPIADGPPTFVWQLAPINESVPVARTAKRAANLLLQSGDDNRLLNAHALDFWAQTLADAAKEARAPAFLPPARPTGIPTPTFEPLARADDNAARPDAPPDHPTDAPAPVSQPAPRPQLARAQNLWPFWNAPARDWIGKRRLAASWCRLAALNAPSTRLDEAADALEQAAAALESASQTALTCDAARLDQNPAALDTLSQKCYQARDAERTAARLLGAS